MPALEQVDLQDRVILITGANSGIGKEAAVTLASWGATVVMGARSELRGGPARAEVQRRSGSGRVELVPLDLGSFDSIHAAADEVLARHDRLDVLINNAGAVLSRRAVTREGFEATLGVNHIGHQLLTDLLLERLTATAATVGEPSRVVTVASLAHRTGKLRLDDLLFEHRAYNGSVAYAQSKLANVLFALELARRNDPTLLTSNCLHPGAVRTGFGAAEDTNGLERAAMVVGRPFMITPRWGSRPIVYLASAPTMRSVTGAYVVGGWPGRSATHKPSHAARDPRLAAQLWDRTEALIAEGEARRTGTPPSD